jgi:hypothetical protein
MILPRDQQEIRLDPGQRANLDVEWPLDDVITNVCRDGCTIVLGMEIVGQVREARIDLRRMD